MILYKKTKRILKNFKNSEKISINFLQDCHPLANALLIRHRLFLHFRMQHKADRRQHRIIFGN